MSSAQASVIAASVAIRSGRVWMRPVVAYQSIAAATDPSSKFGKRGPFGGVVLSDVVVEGDGEVGVAVDERGERSAGSDGGELVVVTDEHQAGVGVLDGEGEAGEVGVVGHAGLVDDDDGARVEGVVAVVESPQQRREGGGVEVRFGGEGAGGLAAGRGAQHPAAGPFEDGGDGVERGGLARTGDADHHAHRGAAPADLLDDLTLPVA